VYILLTSLSLSLSLSHTHTHTHTLSLSLSVCTCVCVQGAAGAEHAQQTAEAGQERSLYAGLMSFSYPHPHPSSPDSPLGFSLYISILPLCERERMRMNLRTCTRYTCYGHDTCTHIRTHIRTHIGTRSRTMHAMHMTHALSDSVHMNTRNVGSSSKQVSNHSGCGRTSSVSPVSPLPQVHVLHALLVRILYEDSLCAYCMMHALLVHILYEDSLCAYCMMHALLVRILYQDSLRAYCIIIVCISVLHLCYMYAMPVSVYTYAMPARPLQPLPHTSQLNRRTRDQGRATRAAEATVATALF
jgi:hypothetical protein